MGDLFTGFDGDWEVQGLSDWKDSAELPGTGKLLPGRKLVRS